MDDLDSRGATDWDVLHLAALGLIYENGATYGFKQRWVASTERGHISKAGLQWERSAA